MMTRNFVPLYVQDKMYAYYDFDNETFYIDKWPAKWCPSIVVGVSTAFIRPVISNLSIHISIAAALLFATILVILLYIFHISRPSVVGWEFMQEQLGVLRSDTRKSLRRNIFLMIVALTWLGTLGTLLFYKPFKVIRFL